MNINIYGVVCIILILPTMRRLDLLNWNQFQYTETNPHPGYGYWADTGGSTYPWVHDEASNHKVREIVMLESGVWDKSDVSDKFPTN